MLPLNKDLNRKIKEKSKIHRRWIRSQPGVEKDLLMKKVRSHEKSDKRSREANILKKQFTSVFIEKPPSAKFRVPFISLRGEKIIQPLSILLEAVLKKLDSLDTNKSVGHNKLPTIDQLA